MSTYVAQSTCSQNPKSIFGHCTKEEYGIFSSNTRANYCIAFLEEFYAQVQWRTNFHNINNFKNDMGFQVTAQMPFLCIFLYRIRLRRACITLPCITAQQPIVCWWKLSCHPFSCELQWHQPKPAENILELSFSTSVIHSAVRFVVHLVFHKPWTGSGGTQAN